MAISPLSTYQWSWRSPDGPFEQVRDLSWIETVGVEMPIADRLRNVVPNPDRLAEMLGDQLTILTEDARIPDELDRETATADLEAARALTVTDDASFEARQKALQRARTQLRLAK